jgi:hypothetical protein
MMGCGHQKKKMSFIPIPVLTRIDSSEQGVAKSINRIEEYLIEHFEDNEKSRQIIDSFAYARNVSDTNNYTNFYIAFYRKSQITNLESIKAYKDYIPPEGMDDLLYEYVWARGLLTGKYKYEKGRIVEPANSIKIEKIEDTLDVLPKKDNRAG